MKNIGVILPYVDNNENFIEKFLKRFKCQVYPVEEYDFSFVVAYNNQNFGRLFSKHKVQAIVVLTEEKLADCNFKILNGNSVYRRMLPEFVRKTAKSLGTDCSVTLVDKDLSDYGMSFGEKLCDMCSFIFINTQNTVRAEILCDRLLEKYGVVANVVSNKSTINTDLAVVIEDFGNSYDKKCVIIDKCRKKHNDKVINDFYIPFRTKPPFGMSNIVFAECIERINCC